MTDAELREIVEQAREHVRRTTFAAPVEEDAYMVRAEHAEYAASAH
jgi:hypothetical protein